MGRRVVQFDSFDQALAHAQSLLAGGYTRCGNWDLAQICDHLAASLHGCIDGVDFVAPWYFRTLLRPLARLWLFTRRSIPRRVTVTGKLMPSEPGADPADAIARLRQAIARFTSHAGPFVPHPYLGRFSRRQWHQFHLIHCAHHLSFLSPLGQSC